MQRDCAQTSKSSSGAWSVPGAWCSAVCQTHNMNMLAVTMFLLRAHTLKALALLRAVPRSWRARCLQPAPCRRLFLPHTLRFVGGCAHMLVYAQHPRLSCRCPRTAVLALLMVRFAQRTHLLLCARAWMRRRPRTYILAPPLSRSHTLLCPPSQSGSPSTPTPGSLVCPAHRHLPLPTFPPLRSSHSGTTPLP